MASRGDNESTLLRARVPVGEHDADGQIYARGKQGVVTTLRLVASASADATAVFRDGGSSGDIVWALTAPAGWPDQTPFPSGLVFTDGLHLTITGTDAKVYATGVADDS